MELTIKIYGRTPGDLEAALDRVRRDLELGYDRNTGAIEGRASWAFAADGQDETVVDEPYVIAQ